MSPTPRSESEERREFLDRRRQINVVRMNTLFGPGYDEHWGRLNPTHAEFITRLSSMLTTGDEILDAACGTGKYWHLLRQNGLRVVGVDHSETMRQRSCAPPPIKLPSFGRRVPASCAECRIMTPSTS